MHTNGNTFKKHKLQSSIAYNFHIELVTIVSRFLSEKKKIPFALNGVQASHRKTSETLEEW
jgi:hypothetical protein